MRGEARREPRGKTDRISSREAKGPNGWGGDTVEVSPALVSILKISGGDFTLGDFPKGNILDGKIASPFNTGGSTILELTNAFCEQIHQKKAALNMLESFAEQSILAHL